MSLRTSLAQSSRCFLHFRDKRWKMPRRRAGGWRRPCMVNISAFFFFLSPFSPWPVSNCSLHSPLCFLSELEQSVELSKKDCQLLKEENLCRQQDLKQVHTWSQGSNLHTCFLLSHLLCGPFEQKMQKMSQASSFWNSWIIHPSFPAGFHSDANDSLGLRFCCYTSASHPRAHVTLITFYFW